MTQTAPVNAFDIITRFATACKDVERDASATHLAEYHASLALVQTFKLDRQAAWATGEEYCEEHDSVHCTARHIEYCECDDPECPDPHDEDYPENW